MRKEKTILIADDRKYPYYFILENPPEDRMERRKWETRCRLAAEGIILEDFKEYGYTLKDIREGWT